ncbi:MAG: hypothetical protein WC628_05210 [Candidatus Omnitrophota bacterium]
MTILIISFFVLSAMINVFLILNIRSLRRLFKKLFTEEDKIKSQSLNILHNLSKDNPLVREYIVYNAPIFVYPFAANLISLIGSSMQILSIAIFIFSIFKFNPIFLTLAVPFFFLSGYTGSRFNNKAMFNLAIKTYASAPPHDSSYFYQMLSDFHKKYYQELIKR